VAKITKHSN